MRYGTILDFSDFQYCWKKIAKSKILNGQNGQNPKLFWATNLPMCGLSKNREKIFWPRYEDLQYNWNVLLRQEWFYVIEFLQLFFLLLLQLCYKYFRNGFPAWRLGQEGFSRPREAKKYPALGPAALGRDIFIASLGREKPFLPSPPGRKVTYKACLLAGKKYTPPTHTAHKHSFRLIKVNWMEHFQEYENICLSSNCLHLRLHLLLYLYLQKLSGIPPCNLSARPPAQHLDEQEVAGKWSQVSKLFQCFFTLATVIDSFL